MDSRNKLFHFVKLVYGNTLLSFSRETCSGKVIVPETATQTHP